MNGTFLLLLVNISVKKYEPAIIKYMALLLGCWMLIINPLNKFSELQDLMYSIILGYIHI